MLIDQRHVLKYFKLVILASLTVFVFWNTLIWMNARFSEPESFYAHGFLVPFIVAYLIWQKKDKIIQAGCSSSRVGLVLATVSLLIHVFASFFEINFLSGLAFLGVLVGLILFNLGVKTAKVIWFSLFFLIFMIPFPKAMTLGLSFYLKIFAANVASFCMALIVPLRNAGGLVYLPNGILTVGAPCSGLKSLISLSALSLLFAHITGFDFKKQCLFFVCSIPVAIISNIMRIMLLILVYYVYGSKIAMGWFHDFSGMLVFVFAFVGLVIIRKVFLLCEKKQIH